MKLEEIATRIQKHLDTQVAVDGSGLYCPRAFRAGRYIQVRYKSYWGENSLTKTEAETYLAWLDSGKRGTHWMQQREANPEI